MTENNDFEIAALWPHKSGDGFSGKMDVPRLQEAIDDGCNRLTLFPNKYHQAGDNLPHYRILASKGYSKTGGGHPSNPPVTQVPSGPSPEAPYLEDDIPF